MLPQKFGLLGFQERKHLQEWIAENPSLLGEDEELLIIQKEFAGFAGTGERLDLLALDKGGNLVVIENKLDDSGTDVTWQALKYVSYCSTLKATGIMRIFQKYLEKSGTGKDAETELREFFGQNDFATKLDQGYQRIILVAARFRKEVTATVKWLCDRGIIIKCIKVTPYKHGESIIIDTEQIIPVKDAEEYVMRLKENFTKTIATAEANALKSRLYFSEIGIEPGAELVHVDDPTIKCTVVDDRQVRCDDTTYPSLVHLLTELGRYEKKDDSAPEQFRYGDETLRAIRKRMQNERKI